MTTHSPDKNKLYSGWSADTQPAARRYGSTSSSSQQQLGCPTAAAGHAGCSWQVTRGAGECCEHCYQDLQLTDLPHQPPAACSTAPSWCQNRLRGPTLEEPEHKAQLREQPH